VSEEEQKLRAFLADLVSVCEKHSMAILNRDEYGIALARWTGWEGGFPSPETWKRPLLSLYDITPDGFGCKENQPEMVANGL
jgi:hypothetical protein